MTTPEEVIRKKLDRPRQKAPMFLAEDMIQALAAAGYMIVPKKSLEEWRDKLRGQAKILRELTGDDYHDQPPGI